ncbi:MAG: hypothetical protein V3T22_03835, partial [Planctomycetota bacterium]
MVRSVAILALCSVGAVWLSPVRIVIALALGLMLVLMVCDMLMTPSPRLLDVRRRLPERAGLSNDFVRVACIEAGPRVRLRDGLEIELWEECSPALEVRARTRSGESVP